ncbi:MAG: hypothetical protein WD646_13500 [Actinomycetota bacterium]
MDGNKLLAPTVRVVRRIDHLSMVVDDAAATFGMLRDRLGLVVMTPV